MWKRKRVSITFLVGVFKFQARCSGLVNVTADNELLENYIEDIEDVEDVEFLEAIVQDYTEDDIPSEGEISESDVGEVLYVSIY